MSDLAVDLRVRPRRVSAGDRLELECEVTNEGAGPIDTRVRASRLLVDGTESDAWSLAIANGLRDEREFALPAGERVRFRRRLPATSVLDGAGAHRLVLEVRGARSDPVGVELVDTTG